MPESQIECLDALELLHQFGGDRQLENTVGVRIVPERDCQVFARELASGHSL